MSKNKIPLDTIKESLTRLKEASLAYDPRTTSPEEGTKNINVNLSPDEMVANRVSAAMSKNIPIPATMSPATAAARRMGSTPAAPVAPIPATMSPQTALARKIGTGTATTPQPNADGALSIKRAAEQAAEDRLRKASGMSPSEMDKAFIPEARMKKLCEVVKRVRQEALEEQKVTPQGYQKKQRLSIVAPDHKVEDSPNARHLEEVLGRSNMSQLKVVSDKAGAINGGARPMSQRTPGRYLYGEENSEAVPENKKKSAKELKQAAKDGVEVNPQLDDLKQE